MSDAIELRNTFFTYPNGYVANEDISITIQQGESVAIVGQNGAGKTTAVKMMNGLHYPSQGDVFVNGINTKDRTTAQISSMVGYVFQNPDDQIFNQTVRKEIEYMPRYLKLPEEEIAVRLKEAVELTGVEKYLDVNPFDIPYSTRKFIAIAAILATKPQYIILDEPTAGQDLIGIQVLEQLIQRLKEKGIAVITITHDMEFVVNNFTRVVAMANKHIVLDSTAENIFSQEEILRQCQIKKPQIARVAQSIGCPERIMLRHQLKEMLMARGD